MAHLEVTLHMNNGMTVIFAAEKYSTERNPLGGVSLKLTHCEDPTLPRLHHVELDQVQVITHRRIEEEA